MLTVLSIGWADKPVGRRVISLTSAYYIVAQRWKCEKEVTRMGSRGCGMSFRLYDERILEQLPWGLQQSFPGMSSGLVLMRPSSNSSMLIAFLTHRSGIDKSLMSLIRSGVARRLCGNGWSHVLRELHHREHDILHLHYLHKIHEKIVKNPHAANEPHQPFSDFKDRHGYAGYIPSRKYLNTVYANQIIQIRPILDRCQSSLTGAVLKWDHSFQVRLNSGTFL